MRDYYTEPPESYRVINVAHSDNPVAVIADAEAWHAREKYPDVMGRGPMFALAEREADGRWRVICADEGNPQGSRDSLGRECRLRAKAAREAGDSAAEREWMAGAMRMDWEKLNELTVRDCRFRIIRGDIFIRMGPDGPEPPRPSDPDPMPVGKGRSAPSRTDGFLIDPLAATGMSEGILKVDLLGFSYPAAIVPPDVRADSLRAKETHPGGVLLPPVFAVARYADDKWTPMTMGADTPQSIRDTLVAYFRTVAPRTQQLDEKTIARFAQAANRLERKRRDEIQVMGLRYRVVRMERLVRLGPDGPELPRPSEWDPELPVSVQAAQDRAAGLLVDDDRAAHPEG